MSDLLFTFSQQQLSAEIKVVNFSRESFGFPSSQKNKTQTTLRAFRSKRIKRYDQILDSIACQEGEVNKAKGEILLLETASQQLDKIKELTKHLLPFSSKTIEEKRRPVLSSRCKRILTEHNKIQLPKKGEMPLRPRQIAALNIPIQPIESKQLKSQAFKKRSLSLKQQPMVHFPANDRKLPKVFRFSATSSDKKRKNIENSLQETGNNFDRVVVRKLTMGKKVNNNEACFNSEPKKMTDTDSPTKMDFQFQNQEERTPFFKSKY